jgi:hypothetical protein
VEGCEGVKMNMDIYKPSAYYITWGTLSIVIMIIGLLMGE